VLVLPAWARNENNQKPAYLALGDSLAFGYNPLIQPPNLSQYLGYPKMVDFIIGDTLTNASCPGETSSTFVGTSTVFFPGFDCVAMRQQNQLFVPYNGAQNQLDYAVAFLAANPNTKLVTIDIGVNDLALLEIGCQTQFAGNPQAIVACEESGLPATLTTIGQNLTAVFSAIRSTGYKRPIVAVDAFAYNYTDPIETGALTLFNQLTSQVGSQFGVTVADVYPVFQTADSGFGGSTCAAGLLLKYPDGTCDTHPNALGQALIAATVLQATQK
jgi:lysophospholipase L1-like esterase